MGRYGNFPSQEELKEYIVETHSSEDKIIQYFEVHCVTSYNKLGKAQKLNPFPGAEMGAFVNKISGMQIGHQQIEIKQHGVQPVV